MATFDLGFPPSQYRSDRPGYHGTDLQTFFATFPDDEACLAYIFKTRFNADPVCSRCGKRGRWRKHEWQKHYFHPCGGICSPLVGTLFTRTRIPLQLWFYAMLCFTNSAEGMASPFLARHIGITEPTALYMGHRIRTQMALIDKDKCVGGAGERITVRLTKICRIINKNERSPNYAFLIAVADSRRVNSAIIQYPRRHRVKKIIDRLIVPGSIIETDCYQTFRILSDYGHDFHLAKFIVRSSEESNNSIKIIHGFNQYINLSFHDQYRGVYLKNAWLYIKEYEFRYNRRLRSECAFWDLISEFPLFDISGLDALREKSMLVN